MNRTVIKRWTKISLRTLHLLAVAGVGGGIIFGLENELWRSYWWLAIFSGVLMMLIDVLATPVWFVQVRGIVIIFKLILFAFLGHDPAWDVYLLVFIIIISGVVSHAPGDLRYYSLYHRKIMSSSLNTKG